MKVRLYAILCSLVLLFSLAGIPSAAEPAESGTGQTAVQLPDTSGYMGIAENGNAALYVDLGTANIILIDKKTGQKWSAFEEGASGAFSSMLNVSYISADGIGATVQAPGRDAGFEILKINNGIKIVFSFQTENTGFTVPITFVLSESYAEAAIVYGEIKESGGSRITDIELLPNLMYGTNEQDGYVFIPDGSGAIINYSDALSKSETYSARIYGNDPCQDLIYPIISDSKKALLPVYGAVRGDSALFGVITAGDVYATVRAATVSGTLTASSQFIYREHDMTGIQSSSGGERTLDIIQSAPMATQPTVRFYILSGEEADYSGMANCYRGYLTESGALSDRESEPTPAVSVQAFGAVPEKKVIFGIPITTVRKATAFDDLSALYSKLTENGEAAPSFYLYGFLSGGYGAKTVTGEKYIGKLGGKKGYEAFCELAGRDNVYTVYNTERSYGRPFDFLRFNDYMSSLNQTAVKVHYRSIASGLWNTDFGAWSFYTVSYQQRLVTKLLKKVSAGSGIVFEHYGEELLSDFTSDKTTGRGEYLSFITQAVEKSRAKGLHIALEGGNAYAAPLADELYGIPLESSGFAIESRSVPFYTMVYHSYIGLSSSPVNFESDSDTFALKAFEQGVSASYAVTGCDPYELKDTVFNFLYNSKAENLLPDMQRYSKDYTEIHTTLADKAIVHHEYLGDLSITAYENGWKIVCNYGETEQTYNNTKIAQLDYLVIK